MTKPHVQPDLVLGSRVVEGALLLFVAISFVAFPSGIRADDPLSGAEPSAPLERSADERPTNPPPYQAPVNFSAPPRDYESVNVSRWTVLVEQQLLDEEPELARRALERLRQQLDELMRVLPGSSHERFAGLTLFLMYGERATWGGRDNGLEYFQKVAPQHFRHLDPRMSSAILIYSAENYDWLPERRALMALAHEFAHAYQLEQWPENEPRIYDAWAHAMEAGLYRQVKDEDGATLAEGYAAVNQLEYFAELSMVYFVGGYYTPFTRDELKSYDPQGYAMVQAVWNVAAEAAPAAK
ncbi:MAG: hypothetical protein MUF48_05330 [Pirellulaceae bacterium]|jgi:hypothetical protein|nr:hypothetical protein [Pirellulaceae bacterium]